MLTERAFEEAVTELVGRDPRLARAVELHGRPGFWHRPPGFAMLVLFILEQQVSLESGRAAFARLAEAIGEVAPDLVLGLDDSTFRAAGFSRQKTRYVRLLAERVASGLDLGALETLPDPQARELLLGLTGVGPWTADVYLLACLRRPDVWPVGDRALQVATGEVVGLEHVPDPEELEKIGERWRPHRASAARILWHSYLSARGRHDI